MVGRLVAERALRSRAIPVVALASVLVWVGAQAAIANLRARALADGASAASASSSELLTELLNAERSKRGSLPNGGRTPLQPYNVVDHAAPPNLRTQGGRSDTGLQLAARTAQTARLSSAAQRTADRDGALALVVVTALFGCVLMVAWGWRARGRRADREREAVERARARALLDLGQAQRIARLGSWSWDLGADTTAWSPQMYEIYGRDPALGPPHGDEALSYLHPDDRELVAAGRANRFGGRREFELVHRIVAGDGVRRTVSVVGHADPARPGCYLGTVQDVSAQRRAEATLRRSEQQLRTIFDASPTGVALVDAHAPWCLVRVNPALAQMLGMGPVELVGSSLLALIDEPQRASAEAHIARLLEGVREAGLDGDRETGSLELQIRAGAADGLWIKLTGAAIRDDYGRPRQLVLQLLDITARKQYEDQLRIYAERDSLTGLLNRRRFDEELHRVAAESSRYNTPATLLACDLDNIKLVNDTLGHSTGDELIKAVARVLGERVRKTDVVARMGGDEFAVLLTHAGVEKARAIAESLRSAVLELDLLAGGQRVRTTLSIGLAPLGDGLSAEEALIAADLAMYEAKSYGRNRIAISRQALSAEASSTQLGWLERLRAALAQDRFELHAQPITELSTGEVRHFELLLRMRERNGTLLMPGGFIPTAERFGVIAEIDRWVMRQAVKILADDQRGDGTYAINLSGVSVGDPELLTLIEREIIDAGVDPGRLIFEFTETAAVKDLGASREFTDGLTRIGCGAALDDFGSGLGSFSYLKHLPVQYVKIDGDFVRTLPGSKDDRVLVKAIIDVARGLNKRTVAEFVSSDEALELLRQYGVDYAQGFHLGAPRPVIAVR